MPRPPIDLSQKIKDLIGHSESLPPESASPLQHYWRSTADVLNLLQYVARNLSIPGLYAAVRDRHLRHLNSMALVNLIEAFERFLKEIASLCVDQLAPFTQDDRFDLNDFKLKGSSLAAHFGSDSVGRSLCESTTWLNCKEINDRFRDLLAEPFDSGTFQLFPKQPQVERERFDTLSLVWQLRHTVVHNVGVITQSDATKLRLLAKQPIRAPRLLRPTQNDLLYLKRFLDETAERSNQRIGSRLAELLTTIHGTDPTLFLAQDKANELSRAFGFPLAIATATGVLPPP